jgi:tetratricopeptide (TPR) repeat protein
VLADVADKHMAVGHYDQAEQVASVIEDSVSRAAVLVKIAWRYLAAGQYDQAFRMVGAVADPASRLELLTAIARTEVGQRYAEGEREGQMPEVFPPRNEPPREMDARDQELSVISHRYVAVGRYDRALALAGATETGLARASMLAEIAGAYAKTGDKERASTVFAQALEAANATTDPSAKGKALTAVGAVYTGAGQPVDDSARKFLHEIIKGLGVKKRSPDSLP